jgi:hypothetical protein
MTKEVINMTIETKIKSAEIAALNAGYLYVDNGLRLHYLELALHDLRAKNTPLGDIDRKELVLAIKGIQGERSRNHS